MDLHDRTIRTVELPGSAFFPSWTRDGRLCFRYESPAFRGFVIATGVTTIAPESLPRRTDEPHGDLMWRDFFPGMPLPATRKTIVLAWAPWGAHSPQALSAFERAERATLRGGVAFIAASDPASPVGEVGRLMKQYASSIRAVVLTPRTRELAYLDNQNPAYLLFSGDSLVRRRLGAMTYAELIAWARQ